MNNKDILKQQLKKYLKALDELKITANNKSKKEHIRQASIIQDVYDFCIKDIIKQFLTNFYHKILKEAQKSKILAIEKKMLKDPDFPINKLIQKEREKIIEIIKVADEKREDGMGSISKVRYATPLELKKDILNKIK